MKIKLKVISMLVMITILFASFSFASETESIDILEKKTANLIEMKNVAYFHILNDQKLSGKDSWNNGIVSLSEPIFIYNDNDEIISNIFNVYINGISSGFIEISNDFNEFPVLAFSYEGEISVTKAIGTIDLKVFKEYKNIKVIKNYPGKYEIQVLYADDTYDYFSFEGEKYLEKNKKFEDKKVQKYNEKSREFWGMVGEIGTTSDGVTDVDPSAWETGYSYYTYSYLSSVPDINQWKINGTTWVGCAPAAASNVIEYWANQNPTKYGLLTPGSQSDLAVDLRNSMGTNSSGSTFIYNIDDGMKAYSDSKGFTNSTATNVGNWAIGTSASYSSIKSEITSNRPPVLSFQNQTYYDDHSVTGVGFKEYFYNGTSEGHQYLIIHDNHSTTAKKVYIAYGRNYSYVIMTKYNPN